MGIDDIRKDLIYNARDQIYSFSTNDLTCQLAKYVMSIGLAKLNIFYDEMGYDSHSPIVIFGPDGGITKNKERFNAGVGYGCVVATEDYIFPSLLHPNGCGYALVRIENLPSMSTIMDKINDLKTKGLEIDNKKGKWDVFKSNHFIDILKIDENSIGEQYQKYLTPGYYALIHSSQQTDKQKLSYWNYDEFTRIETTFGTIEGLSDESLRNYLTFFNSVEKYSAKKREKIAIELFGEENITVISNQTHQGMYKENNHYVMRLGLSDSKTTSGENNLPLFPIGFNAYSFIYLYQGLENISESVLSVSQLERAKEYSHLSYIKKANIIPHGGGYRIILPFTKVAPALYNNKVYYHLQNAAMRSEMLIENVESIEYGYRGPKDVLPLIDTFKLGKFIARFEPHQVIKI